MRVLLDTNVILCGAFDDRSAAFKLVSNKRRIQFYYSELSYNEVTSKIQDFAKGRKSVELTLRAILGRFFSNYGIVSLAPSPASGFQSTDGDDQAIIDTAVYHEIDTVCTYNLAHFKVDKIRVETPGSLKKAIATNDDDHKQIASDFMTVYSLYPTSIVLSFSPSAPDSIGSVFQTRDGRDFFFDQSLTLKCTKASSKLNVYRKLTLEDGEVNLWILKTKDKAISVNQLTRTVGEGRNRFLTSYNMIPIALAYTQGNDLKHCFVTGDSRHDFYGRIHHVLSWPGKLNRSSVEKVLQAGTADPIVGSTYLPTLFNMALSRRLSKKP